MPYTSPFDLGAVVNMGLGTTPMTPNTQTVASGSASSTSTSVGGTSLFDAIPQTYMDFLTDDSIVSGTANWWMLGGAIAAFWFFKK